MKTFDKRKRNYKKICGYPGCKKEFFSLYATPGKEKYCPLHKLQSKIECNRCRNARERKKRGGKLPSDIKHLEKMRCKICGYIARSRKDRQSHYNHHKYIELRVPPDQKEYQTYCDSQGKQYQYLRQIFFCPYCNKKLIYEKSKIKHIAKCKRKA